jgi:hypothetical protein
MRTLLLVTCSSFAHMWASHKIAQKEYYLLGCNAKVEVNLQSTVSRPVCLGVRRPSGTCDQFFFLLEISFKQLRVCYFVAPSLMRGRVCNSLYNFFWALPEQLLLDRSPAELTATFYCFIWDSPNLEGQVPNLYPPGTGWPSYTPRHWVKCCVGETYWFHLQGWKVNHANMRSSRVFLQISVNFYETI